MGIGKKYIRLDRCLFLVIIALLIFEGGAFLAVKILRGIPSTKALIYQKPVVTNAQYDDYLQLRDPLLGWPPPEQIGGEKYDVSGSRPIPSYPQPGAECVSLYGDSYTYASDVTHEQAWSNKLSQMLDCRVANFGVGGYGTDQAFLRFRANEADKAEVTILGFFPTNVFRNLTRNAYFVFGAFPTSFKPRFAYQEQKLVELPLPTLPVGTLGEYLQAPHEVLENDLFTPGSRFGPTIAAFPYSMVFMKTVIHPRVVNWIRGRPSWIDYLSPGHTSKGHEVLVGIIDKFIQSCESRSKHCVVLLYPTPVSYDYFKNHGISALEEVKRVLRQRDINHIDLHEEISIRHKDKEYCDLIASPGRCAGHFNSLGNEMVAEIVYAYLKNQKIDQ